MTLHFETHIWWNPTVGLVKAYWFGFEASRKLGTYSASQIRALGSLKLAA